MRLKEGPGTLVLLLIDSTVPVLPLGDRRRNGSPANGGGRSAGETGLTLVLVCLACTGLVTWFGVVSGLMQPTLLAGGRMLAGPFAYGHSAASLPFGDRLPRHERLVGTVSRRGDVVFGRPAEPGVAWVQQVTGVPATGSGRVRAGCEGFGGWAGAARGRARGIANGTQVPVERYDQTLPGGRTHSILRR